MANRLNVPRTGQDVTIALVEHDPARTVALELEPATFDFGNADGHTTGIGLTCGQRKEYNVAATRSERDDDAGRPCLAAGLFALSCSRAHK